MRYANRILTGDVVLDGNDYEGCTFQDCRLIYEGGELPSLFRCEFYAFSFQFRGAADNTLVFLASLYRAGGGFQDLVDATIHRLRTNVHVSPFGGVAR
jgi:hypothetical protein